MTELDLVKSISVGDRGVTKVISRGNSQNNSGISCKLSQVTILFLSRERERCPTVHGRDRSHISHYHQ